MYIDISTYIYTHAHINIGVPAVLPATQCEEKTSHLHLSPSVKLDKNVGSQISMAPNQLQKSAQIMKNEPSSSSSQPTSFLSGSVHLEDWIHGISQKLALELLGMRVAVCCSVLQCVAVCCSVLHWGCTVFALNPRHFAKVSSTVIGYRNLSRECVASLAHCNTLQHTATHCNTLQHTATHCNTQSLDI